MGNDSVGLQAETNATNTKEDENITVITILLSMQPPG